MSFLPIILIIVFLLNKTDNKLEFLNDIDFESLSPILSLFGVNENILKFLVSDEIKNVLSGNLELKNILPLITSLISSMPKNNDNHFDFNKENFTASEYLNPIKEIASPKILSTLGNYFENNNY